MKNFGMAAIAVKENPASRGRNPVSKPYKADMHFPCQREAFTLLEMLAVVVIIAFLLSLISPVVLISRKHARQADCRSNLRQFGIALTVYRADHNGRNPPWMSSLYPKYIDSKHIYVCKSDQHYPKGRGSNVPKALSNPPKNKDERRRWRKVDEFKELIDNKPMKSPRPNNSQNEAIIANSYRYEFADVSCGWKPTTYGIPEDISRTLNTWQEVKEFQLRYGDKANKGTYNNPMPYSTSRMPIIRCFHHYAESKTRGRPDDNEDGIPDNLIVGDLPMTLNVAYAGNVIVSPPWWEGTVDPGE